MGCCRLAILHDFHRATQSAANALLKTLEEPPPNVVIVLLAPDADSLLPTIVSRCQLVSLRPLPVQLVRQALVERWGVEAERAELLAHLCGGRLGWAVRAAADSAPLQRRAERLEELCSLLEASLVERFRYASELAKNPDVVEEALEIWAGWWRDVMVVAAGADGPLTNLDMREELRSQARSIGSRRAAALTRATRQAADLLRRNTNLRLTLEVLVCFDLPRL
jgi:DNA polymerase-3 subunit delta'